MFKGIARNIEWGCQNEYVGMLGENLPSNQEKETEPKWLEKYHNPSPFIAMLLFTLDISLHSKLYVFDLIHHNLSIL